MRHRRARSLWAVCYRLCRRCLESDGQIACETFCEVDVWQLPILGSTHAALGKFDDARRYVAEAMNSIKTNKEKWFEAEVNRVAGEIALKSPAPHTAKAEGYFERALAVARQQ
jgi:hypothetical protein